MVRYYFKWIMAAALAFAALTPGMLKAQQSARQLFERARVLEEGGRDLTQAIQLYEQAVAQAKTDRALAAQALIGMANTYGKLGNTESQKIYERVVREFADQKEAVAMAQTRLAASRVPGSTRRAIYSGGVDAISADGRWATFTDWNNSGGDLAVRDLISGTKRLLTRRPEGSQSYADGSIISPDGRQVAYLWIEVPEFEFQVRVVPIEGGASPQIVHRSKNYLFVKGWTPNNDRLLVTRSLDDGTWQIAMLSVKSGSMQQLKTFSWSKVGVSLSADGRYIAYDAPVGDTSARDIFVMATDGTQHASLVQHTANDQSPIWTTDGSRILFVSERTAAPSLWAIPIKDGKPTGEAQIVQSDVGPIYPLMMTRNGTLYYSISGKSKRDIYRATLGSDGKAVGIPQVVPDKYLNSNWGASLSSNGKQIAYYSARPGPVLVVRNLTSGEERAYPLELEINTLYFNGPAWIEESRSVLVSGRTNQSRNMSWHRVDLASGRVEDTAQPPNAGGKTSPDGRFLFAQAGENSSQLVRINLETRETTGLQEALPSESAFISPAISPDGKQVAYVRVGGAAKPDEPEILIIDASGGQPRSVFRYPSAPSYNLVNTLGWASDRRHILFAIDGEIWRVHVDGGQAERTGVSLNGRIKGPQVSPDGRSVYFTALGTEQQIFALENFLPALTAK
jgi:Tol biopolymer transport system component